ncbi:MAG: hypothetical protein ILP11_03275 [Alphaproteobacteria bacterium]|nr:hypothetical protein [Alphaproteobacteria bacterium]
MTDYTLPEIQVLHQVGAPVATDYAVLSGAYTWTDAHCAVLSSSGTEDGGVLYIDCDGVEDWCCSTTRDVALCPVMPASEVAKYCPEGAKAGDVFTCQDKEYPQDATDEKTGAELDALEKAGQLTYTGRTFRRDARGLRDYDKGFQPKQFPEVIYRNKRFIHVPAKLCDGDTRLSNGQAVSNGQLVWVEVQPTQWRVLKDGRAISLKALAAGFQLDSARDYDGHFHKTDMSRLVLPAISQDLEPRRAKTAAQAKTQATAQPAGPRKVTEWSIEPDEVHVARQRLNALENEKRMCLAIIRRYEQDLKKSEQPEHS